MKLVFTTGNKGKLAEAAEILGPGFEICCPADMGITEEIPETGTTLRENSIQKASYIYERLHCDCFADDTGLEVDALGGAPGVYSARYASIAGQAGNDGLPGPATPGPISVTPGPAGSHDFEANIDKLLRELEGVPYDRRTARFRCVVTLILGGEMHFFEGRTEGHIALERSGSKGFGYDPVFVPDAFPEQSFAELGPELKNSVSHRGQSLRALADWLKTRGT